MRITYHQFACEESNNPIKNQMIIDMRLIDDDSMPDCRLVTAMVFLTQNGVFVVVASASAAAAAAESGSDAVSMLITFFAVGISMLVSRRNSECEIMLMLYLCVALVLSLVFRGLWKLIYC